MVSGDEGSELPNADLNRKIERSNPANGWTIGKVQSCRRRDNRKSQIPVVILLQKN
jgi:hypothetical protein